MSGLFGKDRCVFCNSSLTKDFPEDYPDEWKFCCYCLVLARWVTEDNIFARSRMIEEKNGIVTGRSSIIEIYKKITLAN